MEIYNKLRKKVYGLIYPDGIPLEFGCEVKWEETNGPHSGIFLKSVNNDMSLCFDNKISDGTHVPTIVLENLGPDLTLQSILRVLNQRAYLFELKDAEIYFCLSIYNSNKPMGFMLPIDQQPKEREESTLTSILELLE